MCNDIRDLTDDKEIINKVEKFEDFVRYNYDVEIISKNGSGVKSHKFSAKTIEISEAYDNSLNLDFDYIDTMGENVDLRTATVDYLSSKDCVIYDKDVDVKIIIHRK
jgi:hypothetical protein